MSSKLYWHFLQANGMLTHGDPRIVRVGKRLTLPPKTQIIPCQVGYHASLRPIDALQYAPGPIVCRVTLHGKIIPHGDPINKYVAEGRTVIWMANAIDVLREFARWCALQVIDLWDAPEVVREYLVTGDENLWAAARDAAWAAAWDAAWDAARDAAWGAAQDAARAAAWGAARDAQNKKLGKMLLTLETKP